MESGSRLLVPPLPNRTLGVPEGTPIATQQASTSDDRNECGTAGIFPTRINRLVPCLRGFPTINGGGL